MEIVIIALVFIITVSYGSYERIKNDRNTRKIRIRVNVNGIRGKSTITRMITSILSEANIKTLGKTTGTAPRLIMDQNPLEVEIIRRPRGVNIVEQLKVIEYAAQNNYEALVCECMAVNPQYQKVYQEKMIQANIGIIVNVLEDHLDLMGPTLDEIALAFTSTIPYKGILIISNSPYNEYFKKIANERDTIVIVADDEEIPEGYLEKFEYLVFPNNISIPLAFAKAMNIDKRIALKGMLNANRDPGSIEIYDYDVNGKHSVFVNAFAANEPTSTLEIFELITNEKLAPSYSKKPIIIINSRIDRLERTQQFIDDCISHLGNDITLIGIGEGLDVIEQAINSRKLNNVSTFLNYENIAMGQLVTSLESIRKNRLIFCIGNIHGDGELLLEELNRISPNINTLNLNLERFKM